MMLKKKSYNVISCDSELLQNRHSRCQNHLPAAPGARHSFEARCELVLSSVNLYAK